jgi:hypothetical protein
VGDPGLDRDEWELSGRVWSLSSRIRRPRRCPELDGLVEGMLVAHGDPVEEEHEFEAPEDKVVRGFLEAGRITRLREAGETVDSSDVGAGIAGYRTVHDYLAERYVA